jgi:gamma-glutamylcyclotransferase (GGCT)/AIG2-like uncharacterized protein YtfP
MASSTETRLAVYGSLAPSKPNEHILANIGGIWSKGFVRGRLVKQGWGAALGFPALILDEDAGTVEVQLFESDDLPSHWADLDLFEGEEYERVPVKVSTAHAEVAAYIYVLS